MLCEKLGLAVLQFGQMSLQRSGDLRMRLPADIAQQAAVLRVLHQRVLKAVNRIRGVARRKPSSEATRRANALSNASSGRPESVRSSASENSRPIAEPICATCLNHPK